MAGATEATLREVCEHLAPIDKTPCSPGEREAAEWIADRLRRAGAAEVALEDEPSWGTFPPTALALGLLGMAGCAAVALNRRATGVALALTSVAGVLDEAENGPRVFRRALRSGGPPSTSSPAPATRTGRGRSCCSHITTAPRPAFYTTRACSSQSTSASRACSGGSRPSHRSGRSGSPASCSRSAPRSRVSAPRAVRGFAINALGVALIADIARSPIGARRERQPLGGRGARRDRGAAPRSADHGAAGAARVRRRRGDAPGRDPRLHRASSRRSSTPTARGS